VVRLRKSVKVELISRVPLFGGCSKTELGQIAAIADELDLPEGRTLIREGDSGREFFVLVNGTARVTRDGRKLRDLGAGDWAGEIALVSSGPRTATVVTSSHVRLLVVTDRGFQQLLRLSPSIAAKVLQSLGERLNAVSL
jgi:CRP/FNR family cyclic AMP-dependent transcriptional regulator